VKNELESSLERIENHAEVARGGIYPSIYAVHQAQVDLRNNDVPYLLELVRTLAAEVEVKKKSLQTIEDVVSRWDNGALVNRGDGITWLEPIESLPPGTDEIRQALKEASNE
jgi:hypothetical protein